MGQIATRARQGPYPARKIFKREKNPQPPRGERGGGYGDLRHPDDRRATARQRTFESVPSCCALTVPCSASHILCFWFLRRTYAKHLPSYEMIMEAYKNKK